MPQDLTDDKSTLVQVMAWCRQAQAIARANDDSVSCWKPQVNSYIQQLVQTKWDVAEHGRDLYLMKPTLGQPKKFQRLTRAEEVVINRLRISHTKVTKSHILPRG